MERVFVESLADVREWVATMRDDAVARAWHDELRAAVVSWRRTTPHGQGHLTVVPLPAQRIPTRRGRFVDDDADEPFTERVGFDAEDRPIVHVSDDDRVVQTWRYELLFTDEVRWAASPEVTRIIHLDGGAPLGAVGVEGPEGTLDQWVERWRWDADRLVRVERAEAAITGWGSASATEATYDDEDVLALRTSDWDRADELTDERRLGEDDVLPALAEELERAAGLDCPILGWDARISRPTPLRADTQGLVDGLADELATAAADAVRAAGIAAPVCVELLSRDPDEDLVLPPKLLVADERWRAGRRRHGRHPADAVTGLWRGLESGVVAEIDLLPHLDDEALRACREITTAAHEHRYGGGAEALRGELADALTRAFNAPGPWPGSGALTLVGIGPAYAAERPWDRTRRLLGAEHVDAAIAPFAPEADVAVDPSASADPSAVVPPSGSVPARPPDSADASAPADPAAAWEDRRALEALLTAERLGDHAHRIAHEVAAFGFKAVRPRAGDPVPTSRIGGPGLLRPDQEWPRNAAGTALALLAVVALGELDPAHRPAGWPADGTLIFWGDLGPDEYGTPALIEPAECLPGGRALVIHAPAGETLRSVDPGSRPSTGRASPVRWKPVLTIPDGYDAATEIGLDTFEGESYEEVVETLRAVEPYSPGVGSARVGGHDTGVQGHGPEPGTQLLLSLFDEDKTLLGFHGDVQFRIPDDAVAGWDLSRVTTWPEF